MIEITAHTIMMNKNYFKYIYYKIKMKKSFSILIPLFAGLLIGTGATLSFLNLSDVTRKQSVEVLAEDLSEKNNSSTVSVEESINDSTVSVEESVTITGYRNRSLPRISDDWVVYYRQIASKAYKDPDRFTEVPYTPYKKLVLNVHQNIDSVYSNEYLNNNLNRYISELDLFCSNNQNVIKCSKSMANLFISYNRIAEFHNNEILVNSYLE